MPVLLALLSSALWGTSDFLGGTAARRLPVTSVLGVSQLVALLGLTALAVSTGALTTDRGYLAPGVAAGLIGMLSLAAFYRALAVGTMGVVAPIAALGVVVPVAAGFAQGERPGALQLAGIALAVAGVVLASGPELRPGRSGAVPLLLAAFSAVGFGTVFVLVAAAAEAGGTAPVVMTLLTMRLASVTALTLLLLAVVRRRGAELSVRRADLPVLVTIGLFDVGANASFAIASQSDLLSVTAVLASLYPVMTVLLARRFHLERLAPVQLFGVAGALAGVLLIAGG